MAGLEQPPAHQNGLTMRRLLLYCLGGLILCTPVGGHINDVEGRHCQGAVRHVHLSVGPEPSTMMTVSFSSMPSQNNKAPHGAVLIGKHRDMLHRVVIESEEALWYNASVVKKRIFPTYHSPYQHHITIDGLEPDTRYFYQCIVRNSLSELKELEELSSSRKNFRAKLKKDHTFITQSLEGDEMETTPLGKEADKVAESEDEDRQRRLMPLPYDPELHGRCPNPDFIHHFRTAPPPGPENTLKLAVVGDLGQFSHSIDTMKHLRKHRREVQAMILAGDIAYPQLDARRWDTFFDFLDDYPYVDSVPLMIAAGNHDIDKVEQDNDIFLAYEHRFRMPRIQAPIMEAYDGPLKKFQMNAVPYPLPYEYGNAYYSFVYGPSHHIVLNSYSAMEPGSAQYEWLLTALAKVDRDITPWLFFTFHVPMYNTFVNHQKDKQVPPQREHIEPLLVEHKVNMVFSGHVHAYMRTKNVAFGNVTRTGPIYVLVGAGGRDAKSKFVHEEPEEWVSIRDHSVYGYGSIEIYNRTHARWDWIHTGQESDHNVVWKSDVELPAGGTDHLIVHNQYYLEDNENADFVYREDQVEEDDTI